MLWVTYGPSAQTIHFSMYTECNLNNNDNNMALRQVQVCSLKKPTKSNLSPVS